MFLLTLTFICLQTWMKHVDAGCSVFQAVSDLEKERCRHPGTVSARDKSKGCLAREHHAATDLQMDSVL